MALGYPIIITSTEWSVACLIKVNEGIDCVSGSLGIGFLHTNAWLDKHGGIRLDQRTGDRAESFDNRTSEGKRLPKSK